MEARLTSETDITGFRAEVRHLLAQQVPPDAVTWRADVRDGVFTPNGDEARPRGVARASTALVPASFMRLTELVVMHRDPGRFDLLYRLLWRLVHEPTLRADAMDADMLQAQHMAHAVRREIHKLKTTLRFRVIGVDGNRIEIAWCEPSHHVIECVAPFFAKKVPDRHWAILSTERCADFDREQLLYGPGIPREATPGYDGSDEAWRACHRSVFGTAQPA